MTLTLRFRRPLKMIEPLGVFAQNSFDGRRAQVAALNQAVSELVVTEGVAVGKVGGCQSRRVVFAIRARVRESDQFSKTSTNRIHERNLSLSARC